MKRIFTLCMFALLAAATVSAQGYRKWDFTQWSPQTVANLMAGEDWSDIEKAGGTAPTDLSKDNCFWEVTASGNADGTTLMANGSVISELEGLLYTNTTSRSLAIAVNYQGPVGDGFGPYQGPSYLWMGSSKKNYFIIPRVAPGTVIRMGVESHKLTDARGVQLYLGHGTSGTKLLAPDGSEVSAPTTYTEQEWIVPTDTVDTPNDDGTYDIQMYNTNGCHVYYIEVGDASEKSNVAYLYGGSIDAELAYPIIGQSDNYVVTPLEANATLSFDELTQYDAIVISSTVTNADAISSLKAIQPFVPTLNLNPQLYTAWGYGTLVESPTPFVIVKNTSHALFRDLELIPNEENDNTPEVLPLGESAFQALQLTADKLFADDVVLGVPYGDEEHVAIHAHNLTHNAYLYIPYTQEVLAGAASPMLLVNAVKVLTASKAKVTQAPKPTFALDYKDMQTDVTIKSAAPRAEIFYTLDGSEPTIQSTRYTEPISITTEGVTVKAVALGDGYLLSDVAEQAIDLRQQAAAPAIHMEQQDGQTTVDFLVEKIGYQGDVNIYYNYSGSSDVAKSTLYTGPVTVTTVGRTIYAFVAVEGMVNSELVSAPVEIQNPKVRIDVLAHMDANATDYNGGSTSTAYYFSWGKDKAAYPYYDPESIQETENEEGEIVTTYTALNPEEEKDFENGWLIRSRGQLVIWENIETGTNFGDNSGYNFATVDDQNPFFPVTKSYINLADKNTQPSDASFPYNAYITTTAKFAGPFDVVANIGSIVKPSTDASAEPTKHDIVIEVATDGNTADANWQVLGDTISIVGRNRLTTNITRSYEGTDEVYVRAYLCGHNSKAGFYDIFIANAGEKSQALLEELSGIETLHPSPLTLHPSNLYDLQGRRLSAKPQHGIYIKDGKKYVVR
ncbi:MAG: chitobiase/beta-hexosaminidase C-terminal domain-containing protein [Prevotella sp.]|nr:chitobiase/beta-hexosaminidase C-terminal domain-containing protein [Prevotella sp.]